MTTDEPGQPAESARPTALPKSSQPRDWSTDLADRRFPPQDDSTAMADWAFILAVVPCFWPISSLVSVGLGIAVLKKPDGGRWNGRKRAIVALAVDGVVLLGTIALVVALFATGGTLGEPDRGVDGQVTEATGTSSLNLREGDCFDDANLQELYEEGETFTVRIVPCDEPHDAEVFLVFEVPDGAYPGEDELTSIGDAECLPAFERYVGRPYAESELLYSYYLPAGRTWRLFDDREITCVVFDDTFGMTESLRDSDR